MTAAFARRSRGAIVLALATIYLVWGSTYLAMRITDRSMPPLLMSSARFLVAGSVLYALTARGYRPALREWIAAAIAGIPLYVALFDRVLFGRRLSPLALVGLFVGFVGVALLVRPGGTAYPGVALILLVTTSAWAAGSLYARGAPLAENPLVAAAMQMLCAGVIVAVAGLAAGEGGQVHAKVFTAEPLLAFAYLVVFGSLLAFSAYAWLLKNVRISTVATYAFVNPVVAVALGAGFLGEPITWTTAIAGGAIVLAVVLIVSARAPRRRPALATRRPATLTS